MRRILTFLAIWGLIGLGAATLGERGAAEYRMIVTAQLEAGLAAVGLDWAEIAVENGSVTLEGHAPDLYAQALAEETIATVAPSLTLVNLSSANLPPPEPRAPLKVEIARDRMRVTLTGQVPDDAMRAALAARLREALPGRRVEDLLAGTAHRPPASWGPEVDLGLIAIAGLSEGRVVLRPGRVGVDGRVAGEAARDALTAALLAEAGGALALDLAIRAPRAVIAPFSLAAAKPAEGGIRLESCAMQTPAEAAALSAAIGTLGRTDQATACAVGLGAPTEAWAAAAMAGIEALTALPAGRIDINYRDVVLTAVGEEGERALATVGPALTAALPSGYLLETRVVALEAGEEAEPAAPRHWLRLALGPDGLAADGHVPDGASALALETLAAARAAGIARAFSLEPRAGLDPLRWEAASTAALDALLALERGSALITPGRILVRGAVEGPWRIGPVDQALRAVLPDFDVETRLSVDLPARVAAIPLSPARCSVLLNAVVAEHPVRFAPGSAVIDETDPKTLERLRAVLSRCPGAEIEIGGHTDSQGSADLNARLSRARAEAVRAALVARGARLGRLVAIGYGESEPIASNDTEEGRAMNRRIAFRALEDAE